MKLVRYTYPSARNQSSVFGSPWGALENEIDRLFTVSLGNYEADRRIPVDLYEDKENTYIRAELPGVDREAINVEHSEGRLTITASRKAEQGATASAPVYSRSVNTHDSIVQADRISAAYENGVLTVTLPKREETKPRKVSVKIS